ncbi:MAG: protein phosphatase CheZ [Syntrophobacteraceae bacterium]|jgi:chemotaxis regulatin CheY-phosphate phosphatase CheZ|nr:protein phosphatase CheZ [Syntrophobacteraceae bacterium]
MKKADLQRLIEKVKGAEAAMAALEKGDLSTEQAVDRALEFIGEFHSQAASAGSRSLAQMGRMLERFGSAPSPGAEQLTTLSYALGVLRKGMEEASAEGLRAAMVECLEVLGVEPLEFSTPVSSGPSGRGKADGEKSWSVESVEVAGAPKTSSPPLQAPRDKPVVAKASVPSGGASAARPAPVLPPQPAPPKLAEVSPPAEGVRRLSGKLVATHGPDDQTARIELPKDSLEKMEYLLRPFEAENPMTQQLSSDDELLKDVLKEVKSFMASFVDGDLDQAQSALETIASLQGDTGLFNEIGNMARSLHTSISNLSHTLNPELMEMVEDRLPDSEHRLEHILELTESAANTTMDHVEAIRKRIGADQEKLSRLERHFTRLKPMGDGAHHRMAENMRLVRELRGSFEQIEMNLATILTSQGYQDLTGQIITKIVASQKELEAKLVKLVSYFGGKVRRDASKKKDDLYGPAHAKSQGAVRSQDEVDALLAEFGF